MDHVSDVLAGLCEALVKARDGEISMASEAAVQYVTDGHDSEAYRVRGGHHAIL